MVKIYFLRHFETVVDSSAPASDWNLSKKGKRKSSEFVEDFDIDVSKVYSSTEKKAFYTAKELSDKHGLELIETDLLREIDRSEEGFVEDHSRYVEMVNSYLQKGESFKWESQKSVENRFCRFIENLEEDCLVVSHGMFLSLNLGHALGNSSCFEFWQDLGFGELIKVEKEKLVD